MQYLCKLVLTGNKQGTQEQKRSIKCTMQRMTCMEGIYGLPVQVREKYKRTVEGEKPV